MLFGINTCISADSKGLIVAMCLRQRNRIEQINLGFLAFLLGWRAFVWLSCHWAFSMRCSSFASFAVNSTGGPNWISAILPVLRQYTNGRISLKPALMAISEISVIPPNSTLSSMMGITWQSLHSLSFISANQ